MIKTVLWDADGTLLDFKKSEKVSLQKSLETIGFFDFNDQVAKLYSDINQGYWEMLERGEIDKDLLQLKRFEDFFKKVGITYTDYNSFNKTYHSHLKVNFFVTDDSINLLDRLGGKVKQYIVTNGTAAVQVTKLKITGIEDLVDGIFISEFVGIEKPSVEFFNHVKEKTGYCEESTVIVGDSLTSDMLGGQNAGIRNWWYNPFGAKNTKGVNIEREITNLQQVEELIRIENQY